VRVRAVIIYINEGGLEPLTTRLDSPEATSADTAVGVVVFVVATKVRSEEREISFTVT